MGLTLETAILECNDMDELIGFYSQWLGWPVVYRTDGFVRIQPPQGGTGIAVQYAEDYVPPVWPSRSECQQMMAHLDFGVDRGELQAAVDRAVALGAKIAEHQYGGDEWVTLLDPAGHPFCILIWDT